MYIHTYTYAYFACGMSRCASEATARVRAAVRNVRGVGFDACNCTALRPCQLSDGIHVDCASLRAKT